MAFSMVSTSAPAGILRCFGAVDGGGVYLQIGFHFFSIPFPANEISRAVRAVTDPGSQVTNSGLLRF